MSPASLQTGEELYLASRHMETLRGLLRQYLPGRPVWAFGSRATGRHVSRYSDLDLAVEGKLPLGLRADLMEALDESTLPILVDLVELGSADENFVTRIRPDLYMIQLETTGSSGVKTKPV